jgi:hypothetical protein
MGDFGRFGELMPAAILTHRRPLKPIGIADFDSIEGSDLQVWYRPVDAEKFQDHLATTPVSADNDPLGHWADAGLANFDATMSTSDRRPLHRTNVQNGLAAPQFGTAASVHLECSDVGTMMNTADIPFSFGMAFKKDGNTGTDILFGGGDAFGASRFFFGTSGTTYLFGMTDNATNTTGDITVGTADTAWHWATVRKNATTLDFWIDGVQLLTAQAFDVGALVISGMALGALLANTIGSIAAAHIGEFLFWDVALADTSVADVNTIGMAKWGLAP